MPKFHVYVVNMQLGIFDSSHLGILDPRLILTIQMHLAFFIYEFKTL